MHKLVRAGLFAAALVGFVVASGATTAQDKDKKKTPTIKEIMGKAHKGTKSLMAGIGQQAKGGQWEDAQNGASTLKEFGEAIGKNKPPRGSEESWKTQTEKYKKNTESVAEAVEAKDAAKVAAALKTLGGSCKDCHDSHKGK